MVDATNAKTGLTYKIINMNFDNTMLAHRLSALGFTVGSKIKVRQKFFMKGPCTLEMDGQCIGIRHCDACNITLEPVHV
ncbi:FeoA family protein [Staphylococcus simulans]